MVLSGVICSDIPIDKQSIALDKFTLIHGGRLSEDPGVRFGALTYLGKTIVL